MGHEAGLAVLVWAVRAALEVPEWVVRVAPVGAWDDEDHRCRLEAQAVCGDPAGLHLRRRVCRQPRRREHRWGPSWRA